MMFFYVVFFFVLVWAIHALLDFLMALIPLKIRESYMYKLIRNAFSMTILFCISSWAFSNYNRVLQIVLTILLGFWVCLTLGSTYVEKIKYYEEYRVPLQVLNYQREMIVAWTCPIFLTLFLFFDFMLLPPFKFVGDLIVYGLSFLGQWSFVNIIIVILGVLVFLIRTPIINFFFAMIASRFVPRKK